MPTGNRKEGNEILIGITILVIVALFVGGTVSICAMIDSHRDTDEDVSPDNIASQLSEYGGYISVGYTHVYVNSAFHVTKGSTVYQDDIGIWVLTSQNGADKLVCFHWDEIDAIMLDNEIKTGA